MGEIFKTLMSGLYVALRGKSTTRTYKTSVEVRHRYDIPDSNNHYLILLCEQFLHVITYQRWFVPTQKHYSYRVRVTYVEAPEKYHHLPYGCYPQLCAKWLHPTTYPHLCAINAFIDSIIHQREAELHV